MHLELESDYRLRDGGLPGEYRALYLTFHWGPTNITGTEHTIDGRAYGMEVRNKLVVLPVLYYMTFNLE